MKDNFDMEVKKILKNAENEMFDLNHPYVGTEHMMLSILKTNSNVTKILNKNGISYDLFKKKLLNVVGKSSKKSEIALYTPLLKRVISGAIEDANEKGISIVKTENLLISLLEEGEGICIRLLINMGVDLEKIYNELNKSIKVDSNLLVYDIGTLMTPSNEKVYKREKEINALIEILLRKNKNNPLLIGEAGVGKTAIVEELVRRIKDKNVPEFLKNYKIVKLDTGSLISGTRYRGDFEERLNKIINEVVEEKNIILFIDEIHTLINCGGAEGAIDAANILKPYMARGDIKIIGATTKEEYKKTILKDSALNRRFANIIIEEPNLKDTEYILENIKKYYEEHHKVIITDDNIKDIIELSNKYIYNRHNPDKAIELLDSVCAHVQLNNKESTINIDALNSKKEKYLKTRKFKEALELEIEINAKKRNKIININKEDIIDVIENYTNVPTEETIKKRIDNLSKKLKKNVIGQDSHLSIFTDLFKEKYVIGSIKPLSILIEGPVGTGKTFIAKTIANTLCNECEFIRLDMSEFSSSTSITKLIGTSQGYIGYEDNYLLSKIKEYPYSIILLDDIDKANIKVQELFSNMLKEGEIKSGNGEKLRFDNATIIMTTSISSTNSIGFNNNKIKNKNIIKELLENTQNTIVLDTIDEINAIKYIKRECNKIKITKKEIKEIIKKANVKENGIRGLQKELNKLKIGKLLTKV